ncbi:MAG: Tex-like N-terminal domain-containing protein, partial [Planctomycetota bacterium]
MTSTTILKALASEFDAGQEKIQLVFEMLDAGLSAPFIGRFRREQTGDLHESIVRKLRKRRSELEELDRRRGTILRLLEKEEGLAPSVLDGIRECTDRFELEDRFIPHRRPEPEVQLAIDRGLGELADLLTKPVPKEERAPRPEKGASPQEGNAEEAKPEEAKPEEAAAPEGAVAEAAPSEAAAPEAAASEAPPAEGSPAEPAADSAAAGSPAESPAGSPGESTAGSTAESAAKAPAPTEAPAATPDVAKGQAAASGGDAGDRADKIELTAQLARLCAPFVSPDKGLHSETEALAGAMRILSDRLGRDAALRGHVRRIVRKHGVLTTRAAVEEGKAGRFKQLLRMKKPLPQLQGRNLLALRQAQKERILNTHIGVDPERVLSKVRASLGKHTAPAHEDVLRNVSRAALEQRLLPMVEADVRLELKERADAEALRFLSQHLRQILLTPPLGPHPVIGVDVSAKGDWTFAQLDEHGSLKGGEVTFQTGEKETAQLADEVRQAFEGHPARALAIGHGKNSRSIVPKLREVLEAAQIDATVVTVSEAGLSSYANSELARKELADCSISMRMATSLGRRLQDPAAEILKVDPRHLGLGSEQGLVSKANIRRVFDETIESCAALVGCDVNRSPISVMQHPPGLSAEAAKKIVERRAEKPFESREELRESGILTEAQWTSAIAFLRVPGSTEPLDRTNLHPETYPVARRLLESAGTTPAEGLGRPGVTKGLRRADFEVDPHTWRDLMRELSQPGRDPRPRLWRPE